MNNSKVETFLLQVISPSKKERIAKKKSWVKKSSIKNPGGSTPEIEVFEMMVSKGVRSKNHKRVSVLDGGSLDGRV